MPHRIPRLQNMLTVPDHIRLAPLTGLVDGDASTRPPPLFLMEARAAFRPNPATPFRRLFLSTKKQVIRQSFFPPLPRFRLWYVLLASNRGSSGFGPYWTQPTGVSPE